MIKFAEILSGGSRRDRGCNHRRIEDWLTDPSYLDAKEVVDNIYVNDGAERGVKLCYDFLTQTKQEGRHQNIFQVVENDRNMTPMKTKSKRWFLKLEDKSLKDN